MLSARWRSAGFAAATTAGSVANSERIIRSRHDLIPCGNQSAGGGDHLIEPSRSAVRDQHRWALSDRRELNLPES